MSQPCQYAAPVTAGAPPNGCSPPQPSSTYPDAWLDVDPGMSTTSRAMSQPKEVAPGGRRPRPEGMHPAEAVERVPARAIREKGGRPRDFPSGPVAAARHDRRHFVGRVQAAVAIARGPR